MSDALEWQHMVTAPKDGTLVLAINAIGRTEAVRWVPCRNGWVRPQTGQRMRYQPVLWRHLRTEPPLIKALQAEAKGAGNE